MTEPNKDGSLEALVAADNGGSSGRPVGAQAPVAAKAACVRCNRDTSGEMMWPDKGDDDLCQECWEAECSRSWWEQMDAIHVAELRLAAFGGNRVLSKPGSDKP